MVESVKQVNVENSSSNTQNDQNSNYKNEYNSPVTNNTNNRNHQNYQKRSDKNNYSRQNSVSKNYYNSRNQNNNSYNNRNYNNRNYQNNYNNSQNKAGHNNKIENTQQINIKSWSEMQAKEEGKTGKTKIRRERFRDLLAKEINRLSKNANFDLKMGRVIVPLERVPEKVREKASFILENFISDPRQYMVLRRLSLKKRISYIINDDPKLETLRKPLP